MPALWKRWACRVSLAVIVHIAANRTMPGASSQQHAPFIHLEVEPDSIREHPVIGPDHPDASGNEFGFEGGSVIKVRGLYHLFTSEMYSSPLWEPMRLAHWTSVNAFDWKRVATLYETRKGETGARHALWSPMPIFDEGERRWNLFYVAYAPPGNTEGTIWRAISSAKGDSGIDGPYKDSSVVLKRDAESKAWEGSQGVDSFYPYRVNGKWLALYGSHENAGGENWRVGLAHSRSLGGPWRRNGGDNALGIEPAFIENPIVLRHKSRFLAVYDADVEGAAKGYHMEAHSIGFTWSADGVHWTPGQRVVVQPAGIYNWSKDIRTPLGLVPEGDDKFTLLYTGEEKARHFFSVGMVRVRLASQ